MSRQRLWKLEDNGIKKNWTQKKGKKRKEKEKGKLLSQNSVPEKNSSKNDSISLLQKMLNEILQAE